MKHKGVKIITEEAEKDVTFLVDVDPLFVSLVKHGANQQPFRVIKEEKKKGGEGSGNFEHEGRPGEVGGSAPGGGEKKSFSDVLRGHGWDSKKMGEWRNDSYRGHKIRITGGGSAVHEYPDGTSHMFRSFSDLDAHLSQFQNKADGFKTEAEKIFTGMIAKQSDLPKSVGFIDTNLGIDHALACIGTFKTFFFLDGGGGFPSIQDNCSGEGFPGLIKVDDMGGVLDKDFIVITDCYYGNFADRQRKKGKKVFGPSGEWTRIENDRVYGWKRLKEMGVGVPDGQITHGMSQMLSYIRENQNGKRVFFLKVSKYRGNRETGSGVRNETEALTSITQAGFGPYLTDLEILVQDACPGIELGFDAYFNGKDFLRPFLYTIEEKGAGTVGVWTESNGIDEFILNKIKPSLIETNYRGNISFEFFYDGIKVYCHDPTSRMPFPCSSIQAHLEKNHPEVLYRVAAGENVRVEQGKKYVAQVGVYTEDDATWRPILFPEELRPNIGFRRIVIREDEFYFVPGDNVVATVVGEGDTAKEAMENAMKAAMQIECSNTYVPADFVDITSKKIDKLNAMSEDMRF